MYRYSPPIPIIIPLSGDWGFKIRQKAAEYISSHTNTTGAERGNIDEQGFGALAEIVIRNKLGMQDINAEEHSLAYDIDLPSGVKLDVKCRGGTLPFREEYISSDGLPREAKHNFFARQIYDDNLNTDIYLMTHLETPNHPTLPGTQRQRKWKLYVCGWVSKKRVIREGVFLPRGSLTERGRTWFTYRGQEIEFYNKNLKGLTVLEDLLSIEKLDVRQDENHKGDLNVTSVDAIRIIYDLVGRGVLEPKHIEFAKQKTGLLHGAKPILHPNQYFHVLEWLKENKQISEIHLKKAHEVMTNEIYEGV